MKVTQTNVVNCIRQDNKINKGIIVTYYEKKGPFLSYIENRLDTLLYVKLAFYVGLVYIVDMLS